MFCNISLIPKMSYQFNNYLMSVYSEQESARRVFISDSQLFVDVTSIERDFMRTTKVTPRFYWHSWFCLRLMTSYRCCSVSRLSSN